MERMGRMGEMGRMGARSCGRVEIWAKGRLFPWTWQAACPISMPTTEEQIQQTVVSLEAGELAKWLWRAVITAGAIGLSVFYLIHEFRGLPVSQAMDQAQIGREILRGHGWQTKVIRPLAIGELRRHGKDMPAAIREDTYSAPIPPLLDAAAIFIPIKKGWDFTRNRDGLFRGPRDRVHGGDFLPRGAGGAVRNRGRAL